MYYTTTKMNEINPPANKPRLIVIIGPTASGKSDLGIKLAKKFNGEIISADSRQVYRGMDIGTGKVRRDRTLPVPNLKFKNQNGKFKDFYSEGIKHHLIDVSNPKKQFTASDFKRQGEKMIKKIISENKTPIIVGGTGFYIDILLNRMAVAEVPPNPKLRAKLEKDSTEKLFKQLQKLDQEFSKIVDRNNRRRLIRALEIVISTGKPVPKPVYSIKYQVLWIGLKPEDLGAKIKKRLDARLKQGMIKEVKNLHKQGVSWKRLDGFGLEYRWISRWLMKNLTCPVGKIKMENYNTKFKDSDEYQKLLRDIIRYSKRQMTWFKKNKDINWLDIKHNPKKEFQLTKKFLS